MLGQFSRAALRVKLAVPWRRASLVGSGLREFRIWGAAHVFEVWGGRVCGLFFPSYLARTRPALQSNFEAAVDNSQFRLESTNG